MRRIRTSKANVTWLQGPGPTDLWTWSEGSGAKQELTFFGRTVVLESGSMMTGLCHEGGGAAYLGKTGLIAIDTRLDLETLSAAYLVLASIPEHVRTLGSEEIRAAIRRELEARGVSEPSPKP